MSETTKAVPGRSRPGTASTVEVGELIYALDSAKTAEESADQLQKRACIQRRANVAVAKVLAYIDAVNSCR